MADRAVARRATGRSGMVATAHPLASAAGHRILEQGGNAMDAALAASAVLGVAQPMMSGLGGDTFVLVRSGRTGEIRSINASGPAPRRMTPAWARAAGHVTLPERGFDAASVPGAVAGMDLAHRQFGSGRFTLAQLLAPAIAHATDGVPLTRSVAAFFAQNAALLQRFESTRRTLLAEGRVPAEGDVLRQPDLARTLEEIAVGGADAFYRGRFARLLGEHGARAGGLMTAEDLQQVRAEVLAPLAVRLPKGIAYSTPPVGQGFVLLQALGLLARVGEAAGALRHHRMIEALKLAFAQRNRHLGDPAFVPARAARLLEDAWLDKLAQCIDDDRAMDSAAAEGPTFGDGDTTCLCATDAEGNAVAYITSLSAPFGAAEVVEGTGVLLNNRAGRGFSLDPAAPNILAPGKRTMSTLHVVMLCDEDGLRLAGGTSGGDGQPQWNLQIMDAVLQGGRDVQEAIDLPRWELSPGTDPMGLGKPYELRFDRRFAAAEVDQLRGRGHAVSATPLGMLGASQMIASDPKGGWIGAADARADGCALGLD